MSRIGMVVPARLERCSAKVAHGIASRRVPTLRVSACPCDPRSGRRSPDRALDIALARPSRRRRATHQCSCRSPRGHPRAQYAAPCRKEENGCADKRSAPTLSARAGSSLQRIKCIAFGRVPPQPWAGGPSEEALPSPGGKSGHQGARGGRPATGWGFERAAKTTPNPTMRSCKHCPTSVPTTPCSP